MRRAAVIALVAAIVVVAVLLVTMSTRPTTTPHQQARNCTVALEREGEGVVVMDGSALPEYFSTTWPCPPNFTLEARPNKYWVFKYWLVNRSKIEDNPLTVEVRGNTTITAVFAKARCSLILVSNVTGARAVIGGSEAGLPHTEYVECGSKVEVRPLPVPGYTPLNTSTTITVEGNVTAKLLYAKPVTIRCGGILITSNVASEALVNGSPVKLPYCTAPPTVIEGFFEVSYNSTHSYWLAWYGVEEENKTWWWSYGLNGTKLHVNSTAKVTLHYVLGLKGLPYVEKVYWFPSCYYNCTYRGRRVGDVKWRGVEDGWYILKGIEGYGSMHVLVDIADVGYAILELEGIGDSFKVKLAWRGGFKRGVFVPSYSFCLGYGNIERRALVRVNFTALREASEERSRLGDSFCWECYEWRIADQVSCWPPTDAKGSGYSAEDVFAVCPPNCDWSGEPVPVRVPSGYNLVELGIFWNAEDSWRTEYFRFRVVGVAP